MSNFNRGIILFFIFLFVHFSSQKVIAQTFIKSRSTLGIAGSSRTITCNNQQLLIQQSVGQSSVTGLSQIENYSLRQGFIQPSKRLNIKNNNSQNINSNTLEAIVFPNPFSDNITISFAEEITDYLDLALYDLNNIKRYSNKYSATQEINLNMGFLIPGFYIIKIYTSNKYFISKLIKK